MYNNLCLSNSKSNNFKIKNQLYPPTPHKLKSLSLCARRHIRLEHHSFIDVCLRQHSVPHSRGSSLHCSAQPPPLVAMFLGVSSSYSPQVSTRVPRHSHLFDPYWHDNGTDPLPISSYSPLTFSSSAISCAVMFLA